jgi:hypothetical protein
MPWPPLAGRWSVYEASPGTQSGGFWTALTDQTGNGNDITPVVGAVPVLSGYAPGGVTEVCDIGASDVFRAGKSGGWGPFGQGGAIFVKAPWDDSFANESSRFEVRTGGFGTGGAVSTLLQLRHTTGDLCRLWLNPSFAGPGHFGPTWEGIPLAGTGDPAHWIQYAIRWTVDGLITTWRVIVIGDRGAGVQTFVNTTFTQTLDSVTLDRIVTAMYMTQPRGGSIGYWYDEMPDEDFADAVEADAAELDADVSDLFAPGVYACECDEVPAGFDLTLDFAGQIESFASVEGAITETLDLFDLTAGDRSFPCTVTPLTMDVPALIAAGHRLEQATVRVSRAGVLLMVGRPESPRWGRAGEPVRFTVREDPWADSSLWPEGWEQRVTVTDTAAVAEFEAAAAGVPLVSSLGYGYRPSGDDRIRNPQAPFVSALGYEFFVDEVASRVGPDGVRPPGLSSGRRSLARDAGLLGDDDGGKRGPARRAPADPRDDDHGHDLRALRRRRDPRQGDAGRERDQSVGRPRRAGRRVRGRRQPPEADHRGDLGHIRDLQRHARPHAHHGRAPGCGRPDVPGIARLGRRGLRTTTWRTRSRSSCRTRSRRP